MFERFTETVEQGEDKILLVFCRAAPPAPPPPPP
jgi:hypothetical protein